MATHNRKMHKENLGEDLLRIDCEACLWPGVRYSTNADTLALEAFAVHRCADWPNVFEIQHKLAAF